MSTKNTAKNAKSTASKASKNTKSPMESAIEQGAFIPDSKPETIQTEAETSSSPANFSPAGAFSESAPSEISPAGSVAGVEETEVEAPATEDAAPAGIEDAEAKYGLERLNDLLTSPETFLAELRQGVEPAVAEAIYAHVIAAKQGKTKRTYSSNVPHLARSTCKDPVAKVWEIAASMPGAQRKDVIVACVLAGVATSTAHTQYQAWKAAGKLGAARKAG